MNFPSDPGGARDQLRAHHVSLPPLYYADSDMDLESQQTPHQNHQQNQMRRMQASQQSLSAEDLSQPRLMPMHPAFAQRPAAPMLPHASPHASAHIQVPSSGAPGGAPHSVSPGVPPGVASGVPPGVASGIPPGVTPGMPLGIPVAPAPPRLRPVQSTSQLKPAVIKTPKSRRVKPEGGFMSPLLALTTYLSATYTICDPRFQYSQAKNPRRVLTEPHEAKSNNGFDNAENDYILYVNDILGTDENRRYLALNLLGKGTFGQVVKCQNMATMEVVAVKVIKNKPAFLNQSMMEVTVLEHIQQHVDRHSKHNLLHLKDRFMHKDHLCLVFELLSLNLYEVIKKNEFRGLGINVVRVFAQQLLDSLSVLKSAGLVHCDLKPENILLKRHDGLEIKVIDFGSACHERQTVYTYIQSRFYRSPEVILGLPYTSAIDMWSLGCIIAELFLGLPIFPGASEFNQWSRIIASLGMPPQWMLDVGKNTGNFMVKTPQGGWRLRTIEEQNRAFNTHEKDGRRYFASSNIRETIMNYPLWNSRMAQAEVDEEMRERECLADFVLGLINYNPLERWTPQQAAMHPFISRQKFVGPFSPQPTRVDPYMSFSPPVRGQVAAPAPPSHLGGGRYPMMPQQSQPPAMPVQAPPVQAMQAPPTQPMPAMTMPLQSMPAQTVQGMPQISVSQMPAMARQAKSRQFPPKVHANQYGRVPVGNQLTPQHTPQFANYGGSYGGDRRLAPAAGRGRSATIGQVNSMVPAPIQQAASRVDPNQVIQSHEHPAYFPPREYFP